MKNLSAASIVAAVEGQVSANKNEENVILDLGAGRYYGLNDISSHIWNMLRRPVSVDTICEDIRGSYRGESRQCVSDVLSVLEEMIDRGLVEIKGERLG